MVGTSKVCSVCSSPTDFGVEGICFACSEYVNQDHVYQRELPMTPELIDNLPTNIIGRVVHNPWSDSQKPDWLPTLETVLKNSKLTDHQKAVLRLVFQKDLSFSDIGQRLGISRGSVQDRYSGALKKVLKYLTKLQWVREEQDKSIDPYEFYSACPKCGASDFQGKANEGRCLGCGWVFTVDDSHDSFEVQLNF